MVNKNEDFVLAAFELVAPSVYDLNNSQKFYIVAFISSLS